MIWRKTIPDWEKAQSTDLETSWVWMHQTPKQRQSLELRGVVELSRDFRVTAPERSRRGEGAAGKEYVMPWQLKNPRLRQKWRMRWQERSQRKAELTENEKPAAVVAPITTEYTVKISNGRWDQLDKFVKIYISLPGVHQVPAESVQVNFTERSFDLLVKNLNGKSYSMIVNNLLKPISVEGSSKKRQDRYSSYLM